MKLLSGTTNKFLEKDRFNFSKQRIAFCSIFSVESNEASLNKSLVPRAKLLLEPSKFLLAIKS